MSKEITSQDSLATIKAAQQRPFADPRFGSLEKSSFTESASATSGLTFYDLEAGAKLIYPVLTPLRNLIPRVSGKGGIQANWRAITAINSSGLRIATEPAGPADADQTLRLLMSEAPQEGDQVLDAGGARLFLDTSAADFLDDKALDASVDGDGNVNFEVALQPEQ